MCTDIYVMYLNDATCLFVTLKDDKLFTELADEFFCMQVDFLILFISELQLCINGPSFPLYTEINTKILLIFFLNKKMSELITQTFISGRYRQVEQCLNHLLVCCLCIKCCTGMPVKKQSVNRIFNAIFVILIEYRYILI